MTEQQPKTAHGANLATAITKIQDFNDAAKIRSWTTACLKYDENMSPVKGHLTFAALLGADTAMGRPIYALIFKTN